MEEGNLSTCIFLDDVKNYRSTNLKHIYRI